MGEFIASGRVVDLALLLMSIEATLLILLFRRRGEGTAALDLVPSFAAGACLLLALRAALTDAPGGWIALALVAALPAHLLDLYRRSRRTNA
jgi:hypothetical protein